MPFTKMVHCNGCGKILQHVYYPDGFAAFTGEEFLRKCPHCNRSDLIWLRIVNGQVTPENDPFIVENRLRQYEEKRDQW